MTGWDLVATATAMVLLFSATLLAVVEGALSRFTVVRAHSHLEKEPQRATKLAALLESSDDNLSGPLRLLILDAQILHSVIVALIAYRLGGFRLLAAVIVLDLVVVFVATEAVPRTLAMLYSDRVALFAARPVGLLLRFYPVVWAARALIGLAYVLVPGKGLRSSPFTIPAEFLAMADAAVEDEVLEETERDLIESAIEFGDTVVREVMVPRTDMTTIAYVATVAEALETSTAAGFSRLPVVGTGIDDIVGLVYVKDLIRAELDGHSSSKLGPLMRSANFVPETKKVAELLREMQQDQFHMALVVDEYGGIAGLVTLEDLIEELVGEIVDEYDVEEPLVMRQRDGSLRVDAKILIDEINALANLDLPAGDWDTVGGLVFDLFGRVPLPGDVHEVNGYRLHVERVQGRRITRVRILDIVQGAERGLAGVADDV